MELSHRVRWVLVQILKTALSYQPGTAPNPPNPVFSRTDRVGVADRYPWDPAAK